MKKRVSYHRGSKKQGEEKSGDESKTQREELG